MKKDPLINDKSNIGNEILAYLLDHSNALNTLEGIAEWWLLERQIKFQAAMVEEALSDFVDRGLILEKKGSNSQIHYCINKNEHEEIKGLFKQKVR